MSFIFKQFQGTISPNSHRRSIESLQSLQSIQSYGSSITSSEPGGYSEQCYSGYSSSESNHQNTGCQHKKGEFFLKFIYVEVIA